MFKKHYNVDNLIGKKLYKPFSSIGKKSIPRMYHQIHHLGSMKDILEDLSAPKKYNALERNK